MDMSRVAPVAPSGRLSVALGTLEPLFRRLDRLAGGRHAAHRIPEATLFYLRWRARLGWWWAYSRLSLFAIVFPVVAIATCLVPGLYPRWMVTEQVAFSGVLLLIRWILTRPVVKAAYRRPGQAVSSEAPEPG